ncbi:acyl-CoA-binding domain-containing protein 2 [Gossypium hirsutum]|uniref:Acyl-CoA-binding domain-containing protein 2 n=1 Tax=Gossypium hirsutum TaxID=3635 RepID=A0ABM2ZPY9_GOSHI|nr:acyl-CoA-binding domain-containing protein 2-like [Gossypium hirsutum]XP_040944661.1 acyl-CoA-binding domain-containing protein 2-like [Gossypium hirsutum]
MLSSGYLPCWISALFASMGAVVVLDVNAKDNEGQTPLHYAVMCEREDIAKFLVKQNVDKDTKDSDGNSLVDLCDSDWPWLQHAGKAE